jgi:acetyl-CoA carboxylase biotin carboxyl carrier protein
MGTFYRAASPGAAPFVEEGQEVTPDTTIAIIEVMKLMNQIPAGVSGVIEKILVENGALVEFNQPIMLLSPKVG